MSTEAIAPADPAPEPTRARFNGSLLTTLLPWALAVVLYITLVLRASNFSHAGPLSVLMYSITILGVVAMGQTCVILIGGIDLSVSNVMSGTTIIGAYIMGGGYSNQHLFKAVVICLALGALVGLLNGLIITLLGMPDMIATLAMWTIIYGAMTLFNSTHPAGGAAAGLTNFITKPVIWFIMPAALVWMVLAIVLTLVLRNTTFGRQVYAVGLSRGASRAAGISVMRTTVVLYVISGLCAAAAGLLLVGQLRIGQLASGSNYQLWSIAAVVLGGTSIFGGRGGYGNTIAGVAIIVLLVNGLLLVLRIGTAAQNILYGLVILVMLVVFRFGSRREETT